MRERKRGGGKTLHLIDRREHAPPPLISLPTDGALLTHRKILFGSVLHTRFREEKERKESVEV